MSTWTRERGTGAHASALLRVIMNAAVADEGLPSVTVNLCVVATTPERLRLMTLLAPAAHHAAMLEHLSTSVRSGKDALLFPTRWEIRSGASRMGTTTSAVHVPAREAASPLDLRFHDLRHTVPFSLPRRA